MPSAKRTEPDERWRFGKTFAAYGASDDEADILHTGPESAARPPRTSGPSRGQASSGNKEPVCCGECNGRPEDGFGAAIHRAYGTWVERRSRNVNAEQLVAEWVYSTQPRLKSAEFAARTEWSVR